MYVEEHRALSLPFLLKYFFVGNAHFRKVEVFRCRKDQLSNPVADAKHALYLLKYL